MPKLHIRKLRTYYKSYRENYTNQIFSYTSTDNNIQYDLLIYKIQCLSLFIQTIIKNQLTTHA